MLFVLGGLGTPAYAQTLAGDWATLIAAFASPGANVQLTASFPSPFGQQLTITGTGNTLDLNGYTLTITDTSASGLLTARAAVAVVTVAPLR
ncbi:hypothetical protein [Ottowia sp.]|uniref:hypothetical protein n=1 Tax=Ottowia sp. TaxID=1898956 RepID=UPI003A884CE4